MVLAISDFERQEAAEKIAGQQRQQQARPGMGSGKQHRSNGTGYRYIEKTLTEEDIRQREETAQRAREAAKQRRERKLQARAERQAKRDDQQKQVLLAHINEMLKIAVPPADFYVVVGFDYFDEDDTPLFKSTVQEFPSSFETLCWKEANDDIEILISTEGYNHVLIGRVTKLRGHHSHTSVINQR